MKRNLPYHIMFLLDFPLIAYSHLVVQSIGLILSKPLSHPLYITGKYKNAINISMDLNANTCIKLHYEYFLQLIDPHNKNAHNSQICSQNTEFSKWRTPKGFGDVNSTDNSALSYRLGGVTGDLKISRPNLKINPQVMHRCVQNSYFLISSIRMRYITFKLSRSARILHFLPR